MSRSSPVTMKLAVALLLASNLAPSAQSDEALSLARAQELALAGSPLLTAARREIQIREAGILQAGLRPNPELGLEVENIGDSTTVNNYGGTQYTMEWSQTFRRGRKLPLQRAVARSERVLSEADLAILQLDLQATVATRFVDLLRAQAREDLARRYQTLATGVRDAVQGRIDAGKASPVEAMRAEVAASQSVTALQRAERERDAARQGLLAVWGGRPESTLRADGSLDAPHPPRAFEALLARIDQAPDLARWGQEQERRRQALGLARAQRRTDLTATAGIRRLSTIDETAVVLGLSLPLPTSDRNQGGIRAAEHALGKFDAERESARLELTRELYAAHQEHQASFLEATGLRQSIVPNAEKAFEATRSSYGLGKLGYLEVLDAQRTYLDAQSQLLDALAALHRADITLHRLTGSTITELGPHPEPSQNGSHP